jgi:hypothetical protein
MPYIKQESRPEMDEIVALMKEKGVCVNGDLNYILYKFCKENVTPSYNAYKNFIGELDCCSREIYRRLISIYEDLKISENGDV